MKSRNSIPATLVVAGHHLALGDVESGEQGICAVADVIVRPSGQRPAVRQLEVAIGIFERLDVRLLVDRHHQRAVRRVEIKPDDLGRLGGKGRVLALAPRFASGKIDSLRPQEAPDRLTSARAINGAVQRA